MAPLSLNGIHIEIGTGIRPGITTPPLKPTPKSPLTYCVEPLILFVLNEGVTPFRRAASSRSRYGLLTSQFPQRLPENRDASNLRFHERTIGNQPAAHTCILAGVVGRGRKVRIDARPFAADGVV